MTLDTEIGQVMAEVGTYDLIPEWLVGVSHETMEEGRDSKKGEQTMGWQCTSKQGPDHAEPTERKFGFILSVIGGLDLVGVWGATIIFSL